VVWKRATLESSDWEVQKYRTSVELRMPSLQTGGLIESLVFYFRSFPLFLKPIKLEPVTELSRVARFVKLAQ
jgi:hypothetical protein